MLTSTILGGASWVAELLTSAALRALWFVPAENPAWQAVPLSAVLAATVVTGIAWQQSRAAPGAAGWPRSTPSRNGRSSENGAEGL